MTKKMCDSPLNLLERRFQALQERAASLPEDSRSELEAAFQDLSQAIAALRAAREAEMRPPADTPGRQEAQDGWMPEDPTALKTADLRGQLAAGWPSESRPDRCETILSHLFMAVPDLFNVIDRDFNIIMSNWHGPGESVPEAIRRGQPKCHQLFWGREHPCEDCQVREVFATGQLQNKEKSHATTGRFLDINAFPIRDEAGRVVLVADYVRDVTEHHQARQNLKESEATLRTLIEAHPESLFLLDTRGVVLAASRVMAQRLGESLEEVVGSDIYALFPSEVGKKRFERFHRVVATGQPVRFDDVRGDFQFDIHITPIFDQDNQVAQVAVLAVDIAARKKAEVALKESEARYRELFEASPDAITMMDLEMNFIMGNRRGLEIWGIDSLDQARPRTGMEYIVPEDRTRVMAAMKELMVTGRTQTFETTMVKQDGTRFPSLNSAALIRGAAGRPQAVLGIARDITALKQAEEALRQTRDYLDNLISHANAPIIVWDPSLRITRFNRAFENLTGYSAPEVIGQKLNLLFPEASCEESLSKIARTSSGENWESVEIPILHKDGDIRIALWNSANIYAEDGATLVATIAQGQDITERKEAEEALLKYEFIANTAKDCMTLIDRNYVYEAANATYCQAHGKAWEEVVGTSVPNIWGAYTFEKFIKSYLDQCFTGQAAEYEGWFTFGKRGKGCYHVSYSPYFNEDGTVGYAAVVSHDITERKRVEETLRILVNHAPIGIYIVQDGNFKMINPGFEKITGYTSGELLGSESRRLVPADYWKTVRENAIRMLKGELDHAYEFPFITKSGETRWVVEKVTSTIYQGERATLGYFMDITEHKQLEEQFLQAQKMEAVGTLAGGIAHDFNNILTAILGNIGLAALDDKIGPRVKDRLAQAEAACLRAEALSRQLLTFAKGGAPVKKLFSVPELLTETTVFACVGSPVKCETTFPENLWSIEADLGQIGQVFQNLTINAIQAMPTGGTIKVWAENLTLETESDLPLSAGKYIKISVRDQGMGIPAEHLPRIFDPYFTTKHKGSGLGLASTYAIVNKHHGHIAVESTPVAVESTPGAGTTFHIYLPAVDKQVTPQPEEDRALLVGTGKILVMDDEDMVREVLGRLLARLGYEAEFARDGAEALEMFVQAHGSGQAFAVVILDLTVPGGMGGKETLAKLLEIDPKVKAVVSSGYSDDPIMADFKKYGFSGVIAKPYRISELGKILNHVIMKKA